MVPVVIELDITHSAASNSRHRRVHDGRGPWVKRETSVQSGNSVNANQTVKSALIPACVVGLLLALSDWALAAPWKFAVFCDTRGVDIGANATTTGVRVSVLGPIAQAVAAEPVDLVLVPGDLVTGSAACGPLADQLKRWKEMLAPLYAAHVPVYVIRGNHENQAADSVAAWKAAFPELPQNGPDTQTGLTYRVDHRNACFIGFDQYVGRATRIDLARGVVNSGLIHPWVIEQVKHAQAPWVFVFGHEPAFIAHHSGCLADAPAERDALWNALGEKGAIYCCGHDHLYLRCTLPDDAGHAVTELIVGDGGAPLYAADNTGHNAKEGRLAPTTQFVNGAVGSNTNNNTNGHPPYFGYLVVTIDDNVATGEWKAFVNYNEKTWAGTEKPVFKTLDTFRLQPLRADAQRTEP